MGGYISQAYMTRYPGEASGFISIDSCSLSRKYYRNWELAALKNTRAMYMAFPWVLLKWWGMKGTAQSKYGREIMKNILAAYTKAEFCALADHGFRIVAEAVEARDSYPIVCPTLLLCGEKDAAGSAKRYNRRWSLQDGHSLIWLKGAGHNANTDAPEEVNRLIEAFVSSLFS